MQFESRSVPALEGAEEALKYWPADLVRVLVGDVGLHRLSAHFLQGAQLAAVKRLSLIVLARDPLHMLGVHIVLQKISSVKNARVSEFSKRR